MTISTPWRALTGMPARSFGAPTTSTTAPLSPTSGARRTASARRRTAVRAGVVAIAAALTVTLAPTPGAQAAAPATASTVGATSTVASVAPAAKVRVTITKKRWVQGARAGKLAVTVRTGAVAPSGTVTIYDGRKRLAAKPVGASGRVTYRLPRKLTAKKHTIRAVFRPTAAAAAAGVAPGTDRLKVRVVSEGAHIARIARNYVGVRYRSGGGTPSGFDCSGFTSYVFKKAGIATLPRSSSAQRHSGTVVSRAKARPGDLIWTAGHVAIYLGGGKQIDAPRPGKSIQVRSIWQSHPTFLRV